jgi:hypothetical protein
MNSRHHRLSFIRLETNGLPDYTTKSLMSDIQVAYRGFTKNLVDDELASLPVHAMFHNGNVGHTENA